MTMKMKLVVPLIGLLAAAVALAVAFGPLGVGAGHTERTKLEVRLTATDADPLASGKTKWEQRFEDDGVTIERQRTSTEVEDVSTTGAHDIRVNGTVVMSVDVDALGFGDLNLDSRDGDSVIDMAVDDLIEVLNPDGAVILSGTLQLKD